MKKALIILVLIILIQSNVSSQPCPPGGVTFTSQAQIDNFIINYPSCTEINGPVRINGNDITNLHGLSNIKCVDYNFTIENNPSLKSLNGLKNLSYISCIGGCYGLVISNNDSLIDISALSNLTDAAFLLSITDNDALVNLVGLESLTNVPMYITIANNNSLIDLSGLESIIYTTELKIYGNNSLQTFKGLESLKHLGKGLSIYNNPNLLSIKDLINLNELGTFPCSPSYISIHDNPYLTSLEGLDSISSNSIEDLKVYNNSSLSTCHVKSICNYLANPYSVMEIHDNAIGCNNPTEVENACASSSINKFKSDDLISIFPNPANKLLFVKYNDNLHITQVIIYNSIGNVVLFENQLNNLLDVSELQNGMYIIEFLTSNSLIRKKLIIQ